MDLSTFIKPELFILIPFLYGVGFLLSKIPKIKIWIIDILITITSIIVTVAYIFVYNIEGGIAKTLLIGAIQGVFIAVATITSIRSIRHIVQNGMSEKKTPKDTQTQKEEQDQSKDNKQAQEQTQELAQSKDKDQAQSKDKEQSQTQDKANIINIEQADKNKKLRK